MRGRHDVRVIKRSRFDVDAIRMSRRRCVEWRAALWTEMPRQLVSTVGRLREALRLSRQKVEDIDADRDAHIECTAGAFAAIRAMAVGGRRKTSNNSETDRAAKTTALNVLP